MERGVKTIVCKEKGHLFDARRGSLRGKETPFSIGERRFLNSTKKPPQVPPMEGMCSPKCFFLSKRASLAS
jgi:hypothetical protein